MTFPRMTPRSFACAMTVALSTLAFGSSVAFPQATQTVRVRGSVVSLDGSMLVVKTRQGPEVTIKLGDNFRIASVVKASLSDIKPGVFIGTATVTKDGGSHALEVLVFAEALRGTGEGFAANVGGRMLGTGFNFVALYPVFYLVTLSMPGLTQPVYFATAAAATVLLVYLLGTILTFFLPEPQPHTAEE